MSTLMDCLLNASPLPAETAAAIASHAPQQRVRITSSQRIADLTKQATVDGYTSYPALCVLLETEIHRLCAELDLAQREWVRL